MKRPDMTERLLTDGKPSAQTKKTFLHYFNSHFKSPIMPSTYIMEFYKQCRSNVETRQMVNEIMSDKATTLFA